MTCSAPTVPALVLLWSRDEPQRIGEVSPLSVEPEGPPVALGGAADAARFRRVRPGRVVETGPLGEPAFDHARAVFRAAEHGQVVESGGYEPVFVQGLPCVGPTPLVPGDVVGLGKDTVLLFTHRPLELPPLRWLDPDEMPAFGEADRFGIVGESAPVWALRDRLAEVARGDEHVLLQGQIGTGKQMAARVVHHLSERRGGALATRNAATIPTPLEAPALLGLPHEARPEGPGLLALAEGGVLFLDGVAELGPEAQRALAAALDSGAHDVRLIGATCRRASDLEPELAERFVTRVALPSLSDRREDIPLLARHLLHTMCAEDAALSEQLYRRRPRAALPVAPAHIDALVRRAYAANVRELRACLWRVLDHDE